MNLSNAVVWPHGIGMKIKMDTNWNIHCYSVRFGDSNKQLDSLIVRYYPAVNNISFALPIIHFKDLSSSGSEWVTCSTLCKYPFLAFILASATRHSYYYLLGCIFVVQITVEMLLIERLGFFFTLKKILDWQHAVSFLPIRLI